MAGNVLLLYRYPLANQGKGNQAVNNCADDLRLFAADEDDVNQNDGVIFHFFVFLFLF